MGESLSMEQTQRSLWIGDLAPWMDEGFLFNLFAPTGQLLSVKLIRNRSSGQSEGYAFLEFRTHEAAASVLASSNGRTIPGTEQTFRLNWAAYGVGRSVSSGEDHSLFVGDLGPDVSDRILQEYFRQFYPSVRSAKVITDPQSGRSKGYGFVRFTAESERDRALTEMNGQFLSNRQIRVSLATARKNATSSSSSSSLSHSHAHALASAQPHPGDLDPTNTTLFIGGLSSSVSEEALRAAFQGFGDIIYVKIPQGKGCGFVQFVLRAAAERALATLQGAPLGQNRIRISWGRSSSRAAVAAAAQQAVAARAAAAAAAAAGAPLIGPDGRPLQGMVGDVASIPGAAAAVAGGIDPSDLGAAADPAAAAVAAAAAAASDPSGIGAGDPSAPRPPPRSSAPRAPRRGDLAATSHLRQPQLGPGAFGPFDPARFAQPAPYGTGLSATSLASPDPYGNPVAFPPPPGAFGAHPLGGGPVPHPDLYRAFQGSTGAFHPQQAFARPHGLSHLPHGLPQAGASGAIPGPIAAGSAVAAPADHAMRSERAAAVAAAAAAAASEAAAGPVDAAAPSSPGPAPALAAPSQPIPAPQRPAAPAAPVSEQQTVASSAPATLGSSAGSVSESRPAAESAAATAVDEPPLPAALESAASTAAATAAGPSRGGLSGEGSAAAAEAAVPAADGEGASQEGASKLIGSHLFGSLLS